MRLPLPPPAQIEDTLTGIRIVMRVRRAGRLIAFIGLWLAGWAVGEVSVITALFTGSRPATGAPLVVWILAWTAIGALLVALEAFLIDGQEIVTIEPAGVTRRAQAFGLGLSRSFPAGEVSAFRPAAINEGDTCEFLAFDHRDRTVRFGTGLSEATAVRIAQQVWERFPQLRSE